MSAHARALRARAARLVLVVGVAAAASACGSPLLRPFRRDPPRLPEKTARSRAKPPPPEWFWEPVDQHAKAPGRPPLELPVAAARIGRIEGAVRLWDDLGADARERLRRDGVLVVSGDGDPTAPRARSMGAFYTDLRESRVPHQITIDALVSLVHLGLERALAEVEDTALAAELGTFLDKLDARLLKEEAGVGTELATGYRIARGVVAVARSLSTPGYASPPELVAIVAAEKAQIEGHATVAPSPLLTVPIDYARFTPPSAAAKPGHWRALAWLGAAPLFLVGRGEAPGAIVEVGRARANARAAMILARARDREVDPAISATYGRLLRLLAFVWGPPDDLSLVDLDDAATAVGVDVTKPEAITNVVTVDRVRARVLAGRAPALADSPPIGRAGIGVRLFGGAASADSIALQALVGPAVGAAQPVGGPDGERSERGERGERVRDGLRILPATLDVAAWLGAPAARAALRETHADAFAGYDVALANQERLRPGEGSTLHASVLGSFLDALITWAEPGAAGAGGGAGASPGATTPHGLSRVESILAGWTLLRHLGTPLGRAAPAPSSPPTELRVSGAPLPVYVEPLPEVVAKLIGVVRQVRRGLEAITSLPATSGAMATLVEVEDILKVALRGAERLASDEALTAEESAALASVPARLARIEEATRADSGPVVAIVHSDPASHRLLATATGRIDPVLLLVRQPGKDDPTLVVGAHLGHHEIIEGFERAPGVLHGVRAPLTDASWRARLKSPKAPTRAAWTDAFRWKKAANSPPKP